jgi:small subunit ribosomal protein S1
MSAVQTAGATLLAPEGATPVEGSDGLLLELNGEIFPNYDATITHFEESEVVTGTVVRIDKDEVLLDIGWKSEGIIPSHELSIRRSVDPADEVSLGESVDALVLTKEDSEGRLILSKKRARFEKAWRKIEAAAESGEAVEGVVIEVVKGGLILDLGVRGFLPASLVDIRRVHNLEEFTGQTIECKVIELNRSRNNVVLSRRAVLEDERKEVREQILGRLQPGQVVEGKVSNIVDFGAFVDLEGIDGLIHISEISWSHVNHPSEVLKIGETVKVKVLDIDRDRQRISLGLKQTQEDPWQTVLNSYGPGSSLSGKVTKVVAFGAFVEIVPGVEGLVHISELAEHHVETPGEVVQPGEEVRVKILEIDEERRRISLSIKRVGEGGLPLRDAFQAAQGATAPSEGGEPELGLSEDVFGDSSGGGLEITDADLAAAHAEVAAEQAAAEEQAAAPEADPAPEADVAAEPEAEDADEPAPEAADEPAPEATETSEAPEADADEPSADADAPDPEADDS